MVKSNKWTSDEKMAAILEGLQGRRAREICQERNISEGQYYKWRDEALTGMKTGLQDKRGKKWRDNSWEIERNRLLKMIGEQQLIIDIQKKTFGSL